MPTLQFFKINKKGSVTNVSGHQTAGGPDARKPGWVVIVALWMESGAPALRPRPRGQAVCGLSTLTARLLPGGLSDFISVPSVCVHGKELSD